MRFKFDMLPKKRIHMCRPYELSNKPVKHDSYVHCGKELRALAGNHVNPYDLIMLHIHPNDVLPVYALSAGYYGPPVALFDHSDHTFWIGSSIVDVRLTLVRLRRCLRGLNQCTSYIPSLHRLPCLPCHLFLCTFIGYLFLCKLLDLPYFYTLLSSRLTLPFFRSLINLIASRALPSFFSCLFLPALLDC